MTPIEKAAAIREAMVSALEFIDGYSDVLDGENGNPKPNRAMTISSDLEQAIASFAALNGAGDGLPPAKTGFKWMQVPVTEDAWEGDGT